MKNIIDELLVKAEEAINQKELSIHDARKAIKIAEKHDDNEKIVNLKMGEAMNAYNTEDISRRTAQEYMAQARDLAYQSGDKSLIQEVENRIGQYEETKILQINPRDLLKEEKELVDKVSREEKKAPKAAKPVKDEVVERLTRTPISPVGENISKTAAPKPVKEIQEEVSHKLEEELTPHHSVDTTGDFVEEVSRMEKAVHEAEQVLEDNDAEAIIGQDEEEAEVELVDVEVEEEADVELVDVEVEEEADVELVDVEVEDPEAVKKQLLAQADEEVDHSVPDSEYDENTEKGANGELDRFDKSGKKIPAVWDDTTELNRKHLEAYNATNIPKTTLPIQGDRPENRNPNIGGGSSVDRSLLPSDNKLSTHYEGESSLDKASSMEEAKEAKRNRKKRKKEKNVMSNEEIAAIAATAGDAPSFEDVDVKLNQRFERHASSDIVSTQVLSSEQFHVHSKKIEEKFKEEHGTAIGRDPMKSVEEVHSKDPNAIGALIDTNKKPEKVKKKKVKLTKTQKQLLKEEKLNKKKESTKVADVVAVKIEEKTAEVKKEVKSLISDKKTGYLYTGLLFAFLALIGAVISTRFINGGILTDSHDYIEGTTSSVGVFDIFNFVTQGFILKGDSILFLVIGSVYAGVLFKTKAFHALGNRVKSRRSQNIMFAFVMLFIGLIVSTTSTMMILPLSMIAIPLLISASSGMLVAAYVILMGVFIGISGSTLNVELFPSTAINDIISALNLKANNHLLIKVSIFFGMLLASIVGLITLNKSKYKNSKNKANHVEYFEISRDISMSFAKVLTLITFTTFMIVMMYGRINWTSLDIQFINDFNNFLETNEVVKIIYGNSERPGNWNYTNLNTVMLIATIVTIPVSGMGLARVKSGVGKSFKAISPTLILMTIVLSIVNIFTTTGIHYTFMNNLIELGKSLNTIVFATYYKTLITFTLIPFETDAIDTILRFTGDLTSLQTSTFDSGALVLLSIMLGMATVIVLNPINPILFGVLSMAKVSYRKWYRFAVLRILPIIIVGLAALTLISMFLK